jgi:hypothetical protein
MLIDNQYLFFASRVVNVVAHHPHILHGRSGRNVRTSNNSKGD